MCKTDMSYHQGVLEEDNESGYLVNREDNEALSQTARAFNTVLYFNMVPKNVEEVLRDLRWKKAMEEEISTLNKNETWKKCEIPRERRL